MKWALALLPHSPCHTHLRRLICRTSSEYWWLQFFAKLVVFVQICCFDSLWIRRHLYLSNAFISLTRSTFGCCELFYHWIHVICLPGLANVAFCIHSIPLHRNPCEKHAKNLADVLVCSKTNRVHSIAGDVGKSSSILPPFKQRHEPFKWHP